MDYKKHRCMQRSYKNDISVITKVMEVVKDRFSISHKSVLGVSQRANVVDARHAAMYLIYKNSGCTVTDIAMLFNRDHTTVIKALRKIDGFILVKDESAKPVLFLNTFFINNKTKHNGQ